MRLTWHVKDLANTADLAARVGLEVPVAETAREVMLRTTCPRSPACSTTRTHGRRSPTSRSYNNPA